MVMDSTTIGNAGREPALPSQSHAGRTTGAQTQNCRFKSPMAMIKATLIDIGHHFGIKTLS